MYFYIFYPSLPSAYKTDSNGFSDLGKLNATCLIILHWLHPVVA